MKQKTYQTLEFDKIRTLCATHTASTIGHDIIMALEPVSDLETARTLLRQTWEADSVYRRTGRTPIDGFPDMRDVLKRMRASFSLSIIELLNLAQCFRVSRQAREVLMTGEAETKLHGMANLLCSNRMIEEEVARCILSEEEISDNASVELSKIRRQMRLTNERVREKLNAIIKSTTYQKYLQEPIVTMRNGRYAIPVKAEFRGQISGLIHDQSSSGQTLFIEPTAVVDLGNEYKRLLLEEHKEIERILAGLTSLISPYAEELYESLNILGEVDAIFAKAILARDQRAYCPKLNAEGIIRIRNGRHPLIDRQKVVPISVWNGDGYDTLIITGPNTGGKTVTLKTVGLFTLMAMSGMFIPADENSEISVFREVFADIGDEQSIEQSLSTFSSHMTHLVEILEDAGEDTLVLLDELGAGTDPNEGAALAQAILEYLQCCRAITFATTHYSEIKAFALTRAGMQNASMEFDVDRLCPTYKLYIGIPGKSNAFEISRRLGLQTEIIDRAKTFLKNDDIVFEDVLSGAEEQRKLAEEYAVALQQERSEAQRIREVLQSEKDKLRAERALLREKAREDARVLVAETKQEMEKLINELRSLKNIDTKALERAIQSSRDSLRVTESKLYEHVLSSNAAGEIPKSVRKGDQVHVVSINGQGTVLKEADAKGQVQILAGSMKLYVPLKDLRIGEKQEPQRPAAIKPREIMQDIKTVQYELDLRGKTVDDAIMEIDVYMDDCYRAGRKEFHLIHGKGTGALRAGVQQYLKLHPKVLSYRLGNYGEGDAGVTVVTLKD